MAVADRSRDALQRKRERDKRSQRNKRQREREYVANLEARIQELEAATTLVHHAHGELLPLNLSDSWSSERHNTTVDSHAVNSPTARPNVGTISIASILRPSQSPGVSRSLQLGRLPLSPDATSSEQDALLSPVILPFNETREIDHAPKDTIPVSPSILSELLSTPEWLRIPRWNVEQPSEGYHFLTRGKGFPNLVAELRSSSEMEEMCPPVPKVMDLLFGGSLNPLADFVFSELSQMPFLTAEKYGACILIYTLLRVRPSVLSPRCSY